MREGGHGHSGPEPRGNTGARTRGTKVGAGKGDADAVDKGLVRGLGEGPGRDKERSAE